MKYNRNKHISLPYFPPLKGHWKFKEQIIVFQMKTYIILCFNQYINYITGFYTVLQLITLFEWLFLKEPFEVILVVKL